MVFQPILYQHFWIRSSAFTRLPKRICSQHPREYTPHRSAARKVIVPLGWQYRSKTRMVGLEHKLDHDGAGMRKYGDDMTSTCAQVTTALTYMTNIYNIIQLYTIIIFKIWEMLSTKTNF